MATPDPAQYDAFADEFEEHATVAPYNALYDRPATLRLLDAVDGLRVLDAGCGPGLYAEELLARGAMVVGCDASQRMVELAKRRLGERAELHVHSLDDPFGWLEEASVDVVLCALAYHYVTNRLGFLREMRRVLRPGGRLVISTHHPMDDWRRLGGSYFDTSSVTERWSRGWDITAWRMPLTRMTAEFAEAGFVVERLVEPTPDPAMAESHPEAFARLSAAPAFILFRLVPGGRSR